jgi:hypothetical protein
MGVAALEGRAICLYTPSADPSGMGAHMLDLAEQYVQAGAEVSVMCWPTPAGRRALASAERVGAHSFATTHPRDPLFADTIADFLTARPTDVFHAHVGTGRENFDGTRAARRAGVPVVVQTQHLPWKLTDTRKRVPFFKASSRWTGSSPCRLRSGPRTRASGCHPSGSARSPTACDRAAPDPGAKRPDDCWDSRPSSRSS